MEAILSVVIAVLWCISMFCWAAISVAALLIISRITSEQKCRVGD